MAIKLRTPNTNIQAESINTNFLKDAAVTTAKILDANVTTAKILDANVTEAKIANNAVTTDKIADDAVTLAKISTTGASNEQVLQYNSTSGNIEWADSAADIDVSNITSKMKITEASTKLSPLLHLKTTNTGSDKGQILLEDSGDDTVSVVGRLNSASDRYSFQLIMDPNNTKPRTNVGGDASLGDQDYQFSFSKKYADQDEIEMQLAVFGAHNGFNINSHDDKNGGVDAYGWAPLLFGADQVSFNTNSTERMAFDDNGMHISTIPLILAEARGNSNFQIDYVGDSGTGDPKMRMYMHNIGTNAVMDVMKAFDNGTSGATVTIDKLVIGDDTTAGDAGLGDYENLSITPTGGDDGSATLQSARLTSAGIVSHHAVTGNGIKITPIHNELLGPTTWMTIHSLTYGNYHINGMTGIHPSSGKPIYYYNGWKYFSDDSTAS